MELRAVFADLLASAQQKKSAVWEVPIGGAVYLRCFRPRERLLLLGGGHISQPLCSFAAQLDFSVTVADDRPSFVNAQRFPEAEALLCDSFPASIRRFEVGGGDYVAVLTRGHRWDAECLRVLLPGTFPRYLGMIGSRRRTTGLLRMLEEEGFDPALLRQIHTPIGLDIGALTTREIGISILAQLIACRRQDTCRRSKSSVLVSEEIDWELLRFLADPGQGKVLLLVYETRGSTPVKSGALMAVGADLRTAGTIGGGCSENNLIRDAYRMIGTGTQRCVSVDMSNDLAAEEGMVCGGSMEVWMADVT